MRFYKYLTEQDAERQKLNKDYNHSLEGRLTRMYHRMKVRRNTNLSFSKDEFVKYGLKSQRLKRIFDEWKKSGYKYGKTPTVDRKDYQKGYSLENIQFLTFDENREKQSKEYNK